MAKLRVAVGLLVALLCGLASGRAAAADAEVRYVITNGGEDVEGRASIEYFPDGRHEASRVDSAYSGGTVHIPAGSYSVHVHFGDGSASWDKWFDHQGFTGKVEKTVEIAVPITEVRFVITNGGEDVEGRGTVEFFPNGKHDGSRLDSAYSGGSVRMPDGTYSVHLGFSDGSAHWEQWLDNQHFTGKVEKTVEAAVPITEVRFVITNGGADVEGHGTVEYFPDGKHDGSRLDSAYSGGSVRMPVGSYSVHLGFSDGTAHWEQWLDHQQFSGKVEKTVEVGLAITEVRFVITNGGVDVEGHGTVEYFANGKHDGSRLTSAYSGGSVRMPEGSYSVLLGFSDGTAHWQKWLDNQAFSGKVERTVEVAQQVGEIRIVVTNGGADVQGKGTVEFFPAGKHDGPRVSSAYSGGSVRMPQDTYDVRVSFNDGAAHRQVWLNGVAVPEKVEKTVELGMTLAEPTVTVTQGGVDVGNKANVSYVGPTDHRVFGSVASGEKLVVEAGSYDIRAQLGGAEAWLRATAVAGQPHFTIDLQPRPAAFVLPPPAAVAEAVDPARGDFPYLLPLPGSRFIEGHADPAPVYVRTADAKVPDLVARGSIVKVYRPPDGMTFPLLLAAYRGALLQAGWTVVNMSEGVEGMTAHQGQNGRNIWAFVRFRNDGYVLMVADATIAVGKLAAALGAQCHLALTGVLFDFDKSALKPELDAVLVQVGAIMVANRALRLEVQGHTDNVGSDGYNQPLSEARARSVVAWLTQHGVTPDRLSARGYGKTRPIATNATDEGRAQNRRVEIANPACTAR